jgi:hypothetical protein
VFHPFLEDEIIFDGGLLLAYSPLVDWIEKRLRSCLSLSSCCFFSWMKSALSRDLTK